MVELTHAYNVTRAELVQLIVFSPQKVFSVTHWSATKADLLPPGYLWKIIEPSLT